MPVDHPFPRCVTSCMDDPGPYGQTNYWGQERRWWSELVNLHVKAQRLPTRESGVVLSSGSEVAMLQKLDKWCGEICQPGIHERTIISPVFLWNWNYVGNLLESERSDNCCNILHRCNFLHLWHLSPVCFLVSFQTLVWVKDAPQSYL